MREERTSSSVRGPGPGETPASSEQASSRTRRRRRWIVLVILLLFFGFVMQEVLDPFGSKSYVEISHGDHVHYVPEDRNPDVSISQFPTQPPGPGEHITPEGRIVPDR